jgi:signal transduction histidine kinase
MSSKTAKREIKTAAWRISLWGALAFAIGTAVVFIFLQRFLVNDLQHRADAWLTGELGVLADVAQRTPDNELHDVAIREIAELASREAPRDGEGANAIDRSVFFLITDANHKPILHTGAGTPTSTIGGILESGVTTAEPRNVALPMVEIPFRVAQMDLASHEHIYLGLSMRYEHNVLLKLRIQFLAIWCVMILFGSAIVFITTRRMLRRVQEISDTAANIGRDSLATRVPVSGRNDEISYFAITFNQMLDRIQAAVQQLHTMTDSIAHDLRSPVTAIRGRLELALMSEQASVKEEAIVSSIEELDRLTSLLSMALDVSEAKANALRLHKQTIELHSVIRRLVDLYEPVFAEAGLSLHLEIRNEAIVQADAALLQRAITNLLDNEVRHLRPGSTAIVTVSISETTQCGVLQLEDDGLGFPEEVLQGIFEPYVRGKGSVGHGLGLAFVAAVFRSHHGSITATNKPTGGAIVTAEMPLETTHRAKLLSAGAKLSATSL